MKRKHRKTICFEVFLKMISLKPFEVHFEIFIKEKSFQVVFKLRKCSQELDAVRREMLSLGEELLGTGCADLGSLVGPWMSLVKN